MGPPPLTLGLVLKEELYRRLSAQAMVGQHGVVSDESVGELPAKFSQVAK